MNSYILRFRILETNELTSRREGTRQPPLSLPNRESATELRRQPPKVIVMKEKVLVVKRETIGLERDETMMDLRRFWAAYRKQLALTVI